MAKIKSETLDPSGRALSFWIFALSVLFAGAALYLRHQPIIGEAIENVWSGRPMPSNPNDDRIRKLLADIPFTLFVVLVGAALSGFARSLTNYAQNAWSTIARALDDYRDGLHQGIVQFQGEAIRLIKYIDSDGILINTTAHDEKSSPRNVLLNNLTIQRILWGIRHSSEKELESVGMQCGRGFGSVMLKLNDSDRNDLRALMFAWFKYDSNAGFGRFELLESSKGIQIALRHNFLTAGNEFRTASRSLCAFMRGYIHGVMMEIPHSALSKAGLNPAHLSVRHDPTSQDCICSSGRDNAGCIFTVTTAPASA